MIPLYSPIQARHPTALALGSFDGLHAGHRKVIEEITTYPYAVPTVVSFWPHPREVLYGETRLRLDLPSEKCSLLKPLGIQQLVLVPFDSDLASLSAEQFFDEILRRQLKAKKIAIGENFRFGKNRQGDLCTLKALCNKADIEISIVPILKDNQGRISSSRIRQSLKEGDLSTTKILLGRAYNFRGLVIPGKGLGRKIGWPTANLEIDGRKFLPALGVYAAWAKKVGTNEVFASVMNLGPQPTIDPNSPSCIEVHLLNQTINLESQELIVEPVQRIRGQKKFPSIDSLSNQISLDAKTASSILNK